MARTRPALIPLHIVFVVALTLGAAWTAVAAPGPLKGDAVSTVTPEAEPKPPEATAHRDAAESTAPDSRLDYSVAIPDAGPANTTTSHRAAPAGRTTAGSSPTEGVETPVPAPRVDPARLSRPDRREFADAPYEIVSSGRPRNSTDSLLAYDGDPATSWSAGDVAPMAYAWFDLGERRTVAGLRWYQTVADGPVAIQISNDREEWTTVLVNDAPVADAWQRADIGRAARFVRIVVNTERGGADLAEVEIFGPPGSEPAVRETTVAQAVPPVNRPPRVHITGGGEQGRQAAESAVVMTPEPDSEAVEISVNGEVTRCTEGERCRVVARQPEVVEDCGDGTTTCTIKIGVSAGVAVCDSRGSSRQENAGNGGSCSAESSGGTVDIGEVNR